MTSKIVYCLFRTNMLAVESATDASEVKHTGSPGVEETRGKKRKISLQSCEACGTEEAKYRCPACLKHSCSLFCVKKHKSESGCTGARDKTAFAPISKFDEMNMLSDYRFLEDTARVADSVSRDFGHLPHHRSQKVRIMKRAAYKFNMELKFLPNGFTKRRENSTFFQKGLQQFFWHVKLLFPQSSSEYTERRVPDNRTLKEILTPYIHPTESEPVKRQNTTAGYYSHQPHKIRLSGEAADRGPGVVEVREVFVETRTEESKTVPTKDDDDDDDDIEEGEIRDDDDEHSDHRALSGYLHQARVGTAQVRQGQLLGAEGDATHSPVDARALVLAVGLEALAVLVDLAVVFARSSFRLGCGRQSSFSCRAHTLQQPQPSSTRLTPGAHFGTSRGHEHSAGHEEDA
ncbi:box C/D snoRNA protein 1-like [Scleropages formosus]|uniref:Box C/D snoRNA protein 1 n=1 Tax=Scleropages formosus TaxID=113540 RepID=A0A0P7YKJ1_SCLFO|nr:box C/D snoRNA protein 1-like [Scleropages formosus]